MKNQELIDYLESCGVCRVCQLRYLKARGTEYRDMQKTFERVSKTKKNIKNAGLSRITWNSISILVGCQAAHRR